MSVQSIVFTKATQVTDSQMKALPTTPVELIPAPGNGNVIIPLSVVVRFFYTADYTNIHANSYIGVFPGSLNSGLLNALLESIDSGVTNFLQYGEDALATFCQPRILQSAAIAAFVNPVADFLNQPLVLTAWNDVNGDFTGGDPANLFKVTVAYMVIDLL